MMDDMAPWNIKNGPRLRTKYDFIFPYRMVVMYERPWHLGGVKPQQDPSYLYLYHFPLEYPRRITLAIL